MQTGREHPWFLRRLSHKHLHDQRNLQDLQLLTQAWAQQEPVANPFDREPSLEDDTWPEDVLTRLEQRIRQTQLKTLGKHLEERAHLADLSFQAGIESASKRWMRANPEEGSVAPADKRALLMVLYHSPLAGRWGPKAFVVRRALITEVSVELLNCPHCQAEPGVEIGTEIGAAVTAARHSPASSETVNELCRQQFNWLRGCFNFLNPAITPALSRPRGRCVVSW